MDFYQTLDEWDFRALQFSRVQRIRKKVVSSGDVDSCKADGSGDDFDDESVSVFGTSKSDNPVGSSVRNWRAASRREKKKLSMSSQKDVRINNELKHLDRF